MQRTVELHHLLPAVALILLAAGCRAPYELGEPAERIPAEISAEEFAGLVPDYGGELLTLSGNGRALISQPGQSERVTIDFHSDREASLVTFRNQVGIEGGQLLVRDDSVLVWNRVERVAEKISLEDADLTDVGSLATINLIDLFHYPVHQPDIRELYQDRDTYMAVTEDGMQITVDRDRGLVRELQMPPGSGAPYNRIVYESYERLNTFFLPRKITIFSSDNNTRVTFLVRQLRANQPLPDLVIDIPEEIPVRTI